MKLISTNALPNRNPAAAKAGRAAHAPGIGPGRLFKCHGMVGCLVLLFSCKRVVLSGCLPQPHGTGHEFTPQSSEIRLKTSFLGFDEGL